MRLIATTRSVGELLNRNVPARDRPYHVAMTHHEWQPR